MTTIIHSPKPDRRESRAFTLVEVIIGSALASFVLAAVLTTFLFLGRSGANLRNYNDMEAQGRKALELFAEDTRQASSVTWTSASSVSLIVNSGTATYSYDSGTFTRTWTLGAATTTTTLLTGITTFTFLAYDINGGQITDFSTATARTTANSTTKQIQISLSAARNTTTVTTATNIVLSARYVLRNKKVTA